MEAEPSRASESDRRLSSLDALLRQLHSDPAEAGEKYLRLHEKLVSYFEFQGFREGVDLADQVLDRVSRRLNEGEDIERLNAYSLGVARLVALEARQQQARAGRELREFVRISSAGGSVQKEQSLCCLDGCLARLPAESKALILAYYSGDRGERIQNRKRMARQFGIRPAALRNRALRLRAELETCLKRCLRAGNGDRLK
ncbi:MAG TPA: hypothetical protein VMH05_22130 [Bryobacteraceae bacterium]|nr:hypothetical protein [Bryobacteraceae bacterium]